MSAARRYDPRSYGNMTQAGSERYSRDVIEAWGPPVGFTRLAHWHCVGDRGNGDICLWRISRDVLAIGRRGARFVSRARFRASSGGTLRSPPPRAADALSIGMGQQLRGIAKIDLHLARDQVGAGLRLAFCRHHHQVDAGACKQKDWCQVTDRKIQLARIAFA
jgi:hypothetical protein